MLRSPSWPCAVLLVGGALLLIVGALALYGRVTVLDERAFADRATAALAQDEVQDEIVARITDAEINAVPALAPMRPTVEQAAANVVADAHFTARFNAGAQAMHQELFSGGSVQLTLPDTGAELRAAIPADSPAH